MKGYKELEEDGELLEELADYDMEHYKDEE